MTDRIQELQIEALEDRLRKGAAFIGAQWRAGVRCASGWSGVCSCGPATNAFCRGKMRWVEILLERHKSWPYGVVPTDPFAVIEAMTVSMFKASGLTALVSAPGASAPWRVGEGGTEWQTIADLGAIEPGEALDQAVRAVDLIQKTF